MILLVIVALLNYSLKKYDELYNFVSYEKQEMNDLMSVNKKDVEIFCVNSIDDTLYKHIHKISLAKVQAAVQKLKVGKSDCVDGFVSDNLKKGTECFYKIIALLFSTMLTHGVAPAGLLLSTLDPYLKIREEIKVIQTTIGKSLLAVCWVHYLILSV